jgi:spore germination protein KA
VICLRLNIIKKNRRNNNKNNQQMQQQQPQQQNQDSTALNTENLKNMLGSSEDIKWRDIILNENTALSIKLVYIEGLVNSSDVSDYVIKPLLELPPFQQAKTLEDVIKLLKDGTIYYSSQSSTTDINKAAEKLISGSSVLLFDTQNIAFIFDTKGLDKRSITEPSVENVNKGPKDTFIENYRTNTATIRSKIKVPDLVFESMVIGDRTKTTVSIVYIKSITNDNIVNQVRDRVKTLKVDGVLTTSIIEDILSEDLTNTLPQVVSTERPDIFCADILEGRVGILADGLPFGFIVPATLNQFMQTSEDYARKSIVSSLIRIIRYSSLMLSIFLPGFYVAVTTFHFEFIPTNIVLFIAKSREGVAFPASIEAIALIIAFEILFEAGLRIPKSVGMTISIVGTLVVGQAAVDAKLISPSMLVVIAMASVASFTIPNQDFSNAVRLWRIIVTLFSSLLGLIGFVFSLILLTYEACRISPYGVPYLSPFVGNDGRAMLHDSLIRLPSSLNKVRPNALKPKDAVRRGS